MNGHQHYQRAEELLTQVFEESLTGAYKRTDEERAILAQSAHVHALLANTAAVADTKRFQTDYYQANGEAPPARVEQTRKAADKSRTAANDYL